MGFGREIIIGHGIDLPFPLRTFVRIEICRRVRPRILFDACRSNDRKRRRRWSPARNPCHAKTPRTTQPKTFAGNAVYAEIFEPSNRAAGPNAVLGFFD